jgi:hypothetical protein
MPSGRLHGSTAITALAAAGCLLIAGCGSTASAGNVTGSATDAATGTVTATPGPTAGSPAAVTSACRLVTEQDARIALGATLVPAEETTSSHSSQCVYGDGALIVTTDDQGKASFDTQRSAMSSAPKGSWSDVTGVGDGAFEAHAGPETTVTFYKGTIMVSIILSGSGPRARTSAAITVAKSAASHL